MLWGLTDTISSMAKTTEHYQPNKTLLASLAKEIKALRQKRRLTVEELAEKSGLHSKYIQTIERNHRNISMSVFIQIAEALEVSPVTLLKKVIGLAVTKG